MALSAIITSIVNGGSNNHATAASEFNAVATDFITPGVNGVITSTSGVAPSTGSFAVNQDSSPDMGVTVTAGTGWITATPAAQVSQNLRVYMAANTTAYTINANASGSTKYDWIYLKVDPTKAGGTEDSGADDVTALYTSRSTSNSVDNGTPPTYGILLAVVTVANGASSITNANIADSRTQSGTSSPAGLVTNTAEGRFDYVASGCVWSGDSYASTLNGSMTAGVVYIGGVRVALPSITAHVFTASKDTYIDVNNAGVVTYTEATNNAASPALVANNLRLGIVVTGASNIAAVGSVNQGQENKILPIASSVAYSVTDSLGNLICPRDPSRKVLGYRQNAGSFTTTNTADTQVTALSVPVINPTGRKIKISVYADSFGVSAGANVAVSKVWEGAIGGTLLGQTNSIAGSVTTNPFSTYHEVMRTPGSASLTYNLSLAVNVSGTAVWSMTSKPSFIKVELE